MATIEYNHNIMSGIITQITDSLTKIDEIMADFKTTIETADTDWEGNCKTALYEKIAEATNLITVISDKSAAYKNFLSKLSSAYSNLDTKLTLGQTSKKGIQEKPNKRGETE